VRVRQGYVASDRAEIYYESCGDGRPLLIVQGGFATAGATEQLADALAGQYEVISYDRRGLSRSRVSAGAPPVTMSLHAADAAALLAAVSAGPAFVVGASIGALIGLHLAVENPDRVAAVVAHEPPMATVVADPERETALDEVAELAREDPVSAIQRMASLTGVGRTSAEPGAREGAPVGDRRADLSRFFSHDFPAVRSSKLDAGQVGCVAGSTAVVPAGGEESRGQWEYRCAERLAKSLGRELEELPGGHNALVTHPQAVAKKLTTLFAN
jgi:pimeloyl-ACP methyl ester carboxylesterase